MDNKAPILFVEQILKSGKVVDDFRRLREIDRENKELVRRINVIYRTRGAIDTYNKMAGIRFSNVPAKIIAAQKCEKENVEMLRRLINTSPIIINAILEEEWQENLETIRLKAKFPLCMPGLKERETDMIESEESVPNLLTPIRPRVFLDLEVKNGRPLGRLIITLFSDVVPVAAQNFYDLCYNYQKMKPGEEKPSCKENPHYVGSFFHRIFPNLYAEAGDITHGCGIGGMAANGGDFTDDNYTLKHKYTGTVAMIEQEDGKFTSQFTISFKPLPILNGKRLMFGRVTRGLNVIKSLEGCGTRHGKSREIIIIAKTGVLPSK